MAVFINMSGIVPPADVPMALPPMRFLEDAALRERYRLAVDDLYSGDEDEGGEAAEPFDESPDPEDWSSNT